MKTRFRRPWSKIGVHWFGDSLKEQYNENASGKKGCLRTADAGTDALRRTRTRKSNHIVSHQ